MEARKKRVSPVLVPVLLCVVMILLFSLCLGRVALESSGKLFWTTYGFAVDGTENIYIGCREQIRVIRNGQQAESIPVPTSRSYCFYIEDDVLYIGCSFDGRGGAYDLHGNELSHGDYTYSQIEAKTSYQNAAVNGHHFHYGTDWFGVYTVTRDGVTVFQTERSFFDGIQYWLCLAILALAFITLALILLSKSINKVTLPSPGGGGRPKAG